MNTEAFEAMARHAASMSRRGSLRLLGGAALTGAVAAPTAAASKASKKDQKRCKRQRGQCLAFVEEFCLPKGDPNACEAQYRPCCEHFSQCNAGQGIACLFDVLLGAGGG